MLESRCKYIIIGNQLGAIIMGSEFGRAFRWTWYIGSCGDGLIEHGPSGAKWMDNQQSYYSICPIKRKKELILKAFATIFLKWWSVHQLPDISQVLNMELIALKEDWVSRKRDLGIIKQVYTVMIFLSASPTEPTSIYSYNCDLGKGKYPDISRTL